MILSFRDGEKMSKRKKNFPDPTMVIDKYGADALRSVLLSLFVYEKKTKKTRYGCGWVDVVILRVQACPNFLQNTLFEILSLPYISSRKNNYRIFFSTLL